MGCAVQSEAYQKLYELSGDNSTTGVTILDARIIAATYPTPNHNYERVAVYLMLVQLVWDVFRKTKATKATKEETLILLAGLTDSEWEGIQKEMVLFVDGGIAAMRDSRMEWIRALDTLREFERD